MSLKSKLEAVIYAAEEPVTLTQLAAIFGAEALEWKAEQEAAAAEQTAEVAGEVDRPSEPLPLLEEANESPSVADAVAPQPEIAPEPASDAAEVVVPAAAVAEEDLAVEPLDPEAEAKRAGRQRDRDVKAVLKQLLDELIATYDSDERGLEIKEIAGGYRMATKPECHDAVRMFVKSLKAPLKLSLPALETLAVVAYKQPVTAPEVSEIRGVESGGVLGSLLARKLIATAGRKQVIGRPILYKTTKEFLLRFGLKDLNELPSMEEFEKMAAEIEEMEPEAAAADAAEAAAEAAAESENGATRAEGAASAEEPADGEADRQAEDQAEDAGEHPEIEAPAAQDASQEEQASLEESPAATAAETSASSNEQQPATAESAEAEAVAETDSAAAENEATSHAEEEHEENRS